jgi:hypothetical protein
MGSPLAVSDPTEYQEARPHWLADAWLGERVAAAENATHATLNAMTRCPDCTPIPRR